MTETGWLIEQCSSKTGAFKALWWDGEDWTSDSTKAIRYARAQDAQREIDVVGWTEASPSEHQWTDAPQ